MDSLAPSKYSKYDPAFARNFYLMKPILLGYFLSSDMSTNEKIYHSEKLSSNDDGDHHRLPLCFTVK